MKKQKLLWQLFLSYLVIIFIAIIVFTFSFSKSVRSFFLSQVSSDLEVRARLIESHLKSSLKPQSPSTVSIDALCKSLGKNSNTRITFISPNGKVVGDSMETPAKMDNHASRPEIRLALQGETGQSTRFSNTLNKEMMYVAIPVIHNEKILGSVRTSLSIQAVNRTLKDIYLKILLSALLVAVFAAILSYLFSKSITHPLEVMKQAAKRFAGGDLKERLAIPKSDELGGLTEAMNEMAEQLDKKMESEIQQSHEKDAILSSMVEGVIAIDNKKRILSINRAALEFFNINTPLATGRKVEELLRNTDLQLFIDATLKSKVPLEGDLALAKNEARLLHLHGTSLRDSQQNIIGVLIVLNDVTQLKKLENIRKDFVANVSHELKTPITSIKGFVETLLDGAHKNFDDSERFLKIILKHSERLNAIIDDLLSLSRLEEEKKTEILLEKGSITGILKTAAQICEPRSKAKKIKIQVHSEKGLQGRFNTHLLEQALVNLIDNAIKYSPEESEVDVSANQNGEGIRIKVKDKGCGIDKSDLSRLFERFYRVDKSRSRNMGGTGLGLAIVKHIVHVHKGSIEVQSQPNHGSTFTIHLPNP